MNNNNEDGQSNSGPKEQIIPARVRTQSECSAGSEDGNTGKRQRTTSQQFMVMSGLSAASPPKFVTLEEIMQAANSMKDMALVHQIVVDDEFKLQRAEPPPNTIQRIIKDTMHKAFWDLLKTELAENPPNYRQALVLLEDIKEGLFSVLLPQHTKIKQRISEILDTALIKQQAENGSLQFEHYAQYVLSVMVRLCAPVRDEKIRQLQNCTDVVETFKGILETLDLMQLDMANFTLQQAKPDIIARSVELERKKFADFLSIQPDGLEFTRKWLLKHLETEKLPENVDYDTFIKKKVKKTFSRACLNLLEWNDKEPYPETFMLDVARLQDLQMKTNRIVVMGTILLIALGSAGQDLQSIGSFKMSLKDHIYVLLQSMNNEEDCNNLLPNVAEQVVRDIKNEQIKHQFAPLSESAENASKQQILDVAKPDHRIKCLIRQRIYDFYHEIIESATAAPQQVPSGLSSLQKELTEIVGQLLKIVSHNCSVFSPYYYDIIAAAIPKPN
ncbi:T-complex protein 11-like protein 1 isoform X1 [Harmonia axyridis]|uniref:T-complex protein 11-like protein 1 isoform X1 n=1 Tax=Harmonia axyridis TaxID=115357 RepID=UPI001E274F58|nr:T-complex protein 11-like protein 1 isoform X1 [Harmonia axyridis]XP_045480302.1 T-complex protein 11-like protein 1 isoform X1 [Harmonia axyridis]XP_045480303.1 T-complex protein 11-like protein 1 isoform X1 [Harmonia axyridis]XP_045480304.1 T-complex protein 11-like protein 1 isoform X1 [Harmonia axyridis]